MKRSEQLNAEMLEEMRFHIEMETERLMREEGLDPQEARRQAHVRFGGVEKYREQGRDARGVAWMDTLSLDARLGVRMLVKHRWLTLVGGMAMAVAIAIGATGFEIITEFVNPALPIDEGGRVVAVQPATAHDFAAWRDALVSIEELAAFRTAQHNLASGNGPSEPVKVAEITASGFSVARTPPHIGRLLLPADEHAGAAPVVVIGHRAWQTRFGGDAQIVGRAIRIGAISHTVIGVMPEGFRFPVDHQFWIPLRQSQATELQAFGRLKRGVTLQEAQAELTTIAQRTAQTTEEPRRPVVVPFTHAQLDIGDPTLVWVLRVAQLLIGALAFVVAVNLAILFYARTVTRLGEIAVRTALGATRGRILAQLFIEAFALSLTGALIGLVLTHLSLQRLESLAPANGSVPFWIDFDLSAGTILYALGLAAFAAVIMGVLPGLKATGRRLNANLNELSARAGTRLGAMWTALVVAQVAVAVAVLPVTVYLAWQVVRMEVVGPGFAAERFMVGTMVLSDDAPDRIRQRQIDLMSRLAAEPGVSAVTFSSNVPGFAPGRQIRGMSEVSTLDVDVELFDTYGVEVLAGRRFHAGDARAANAVIVNHTFVKRFLENRNAPGFRFRYARAEEWYQIVGVVSDFPSFSPAPGSDGEPTVYHPALPGDVHPVVLSVRFNGRIPAGAIERFREIGAAVDPSLQLRRVVPLSQFYDEVRSLWRYLAWAIALVTASVLLLSAAGIYALMSFTVAQRTREIGIRTALGAHPRHLLFSIFGRVFRQLALGLLAGSLLSGAVFSSADFGAGRAAALMSAVAALMVVTGLLAALGPARRSLRIAPFEALRTD